MNNHSLLILILIYLVHWMTNRRSNKCLWNPQRCYCHHASDGDSYDF
jgi:hypothetical protein